MLHNDISHAVPIGITVLVEPVNRAEDELIEGNSAVLAAHYLQGLRGTHFQLFMDNLFSHFPGMHTSDLIG